MSIVEPQVQETALKTYAACKISVTHRGSSWSGTGTVCGFDTFEGRAGAWVLTNAHVSTTQFNKKMACAFHLPSGEDKAWYGYLKFSAYSNRYQQDWALVFVPGLTAATKIKPHKLSKELPSSKEYNQTGSPAGIWPLTSVLFRMFDTIQDDRVYRLQPNSKSGQSGSGLRELIRENIELLLAWSWGGLCACQATYHIWMAVVNKTSEIGLERLEGMVEVNDTINLEARDVHEGFVEPPFDEMDSHQELPIWADEDADDEDPADPPENGELVGMLVDFHETRLENLTAELNETKELLDNLKRNGN